MCKEHNPSIEVAHCDLIQTIRSTWDPYHFRVIKTKSHRLLQSATDPDDLYNILGNTLANETARITNKQDIAAMKSITDNIDQHCSIQQIALLHVYRYLIDLNGYTPKFD